MQTIILKNYELTLFEHENGLKELGILLGNEHNINSKLILNPEFVVNDAEIILTWDQNELSLDSVTQINILNAQPEILTNVLNSEKFYMFFIEQGNVIHCSKVA